MLSNCSVPQICHLVKKQKYYWVNDAGHAIKEQLVQTPGSAKPITRGQDVRLIQLKKILQTTFYSTFEMKNKSYIGYKTLWENVKLLLTSNFSFSRNVFHSYISLVRQNASLCGNGLNAIFQPSAKKWWHFDKNHSILYFFFTMFVDMAVN